MRWLINYIRSFFCPHEWELIFDERIDSYWAKYRCKVYRCKKCGFHMRYDTN